VTPAGPYIEYLAEDKQVDMKNIWIGFSYGNILGTEEGNEAISSLKHNYTKHFASSLLQSFDMRTWS
jgi:hypothetical protein